LIRQTKKIAEGLQVFDDIYDKLMTSEISSQKEKLESDLKKEIKKLQRSRDQLKQWLGDNSIKLDKNLLQENRGRIEHAMDQFKDLEKSSKIKQFSNEGLELQAQRSSRYSKFNPEQVKKNAAVEYLSDIIEQLNQQNEGLEVELHLLSVQLKKAKASNNSSIQASIGDARYKIERNNNHLTKLEKILRSIENENLEPDRLDEIKDDLEYYVENNQEDDYVEYDDFYDQIEIDDDNLEVHGSLSQLAIDRDEEEKQKEDKEKQKQEKQKEDKQKDDREKEPSKPSKDQDIRKGKAKEEKVETVASTTAKSTPISVSPPSIPSVITGGSYSAAIKAAAGLDKPSTASTVGSTSATSTPTKIIPPGLIPPASSNESPSREDKTSSPHFASATTTEPQSVSTPITNIASLASVGAGGVASGFVMELPISGEARSFADSASKLPNLVQSRLSNPLPFTMISPLLESSLLNCPDSFDSEKPRQYNPVNIHPSSIDYPQEPMYELNGSKIMRKFDNDTLLFCFYYSEGSDSIARWNAAKELSRRGWIFHTELHQWFLKDNKKPRSMSAVPQSEEESQTPPPANDDGVKQNYKYFDYEKTWLVRRKENYKFADEVKQSF
jgi:CCR4-NOT transcription complex subunit 3